MGPVASLMTEQPLLGIALLPPFGEGSRKGDLKKACLSHPLSAYRSCLGILKCGRTSESKRKYGKARRSMTFGAWNIRTLMDTQKSKRSERMTAIVGHELARYKIDIAALSETRLAETGDLTEVGAGYTFFWSGKANDEPREAGVGFAIRTSLVSKLETLPKGISERLVMMRIPLAGKTHLTLVSAYAPTMVYPEEEKEKFYQSLCSAIQSIPRNDKLILLGDFNARVGRDS